MRLGDKLPMETSHSDGSLIRFTVTVVRVEADGKYWVEFPARVLRLPFPPNNGKRYAQYAPRALTK